MYSIPRCRKLWAQGQWLEGSLGTKREHFTPAYKYVCMCGEVGLVGIT